MIRASLRLTDVLLVVVALMFAAAMITPPRHHDSVYVAAVQQPAPNVDDPPPPNPGPRPAAEIPAIMGDIPAHEIGAEKPTKDLLARVQTLKDRKCCPTCHGRCKVVNLIHVGWKEGTGFKRGMLRE